MLNHHAAAATGMATPSRQRWTAALILLLSTLMLTGCFNSGPDKDSVQRILQDRIDHTGSVVVVSKIDKLNAGKHGGHWLVDVKATLTFKKGADDLAKAVQDAPTTKGVEGLMGSLSQMGFLLKFGNFKAGETMPYQTRLTLIHGDNGWMPLNDD